MSHWSQMLAHTELEYLIPVFPRSWEQPLNNLWASAEEELLRTVAFHPRGDLK